jgi:hypothetical protein
MEIKKIFCHREVGNGIVSKEEMHGVGTASAESDCDRCQSLLRECDQLTSQSIHTVTV